MSETRQAERTIAVEAAKVDGAAPPDAEPRHPEDAMPTKELVTSVAQALAAIWSPLPLAGEG